MALSYAPFRAKFKEKALFAQWPARFADLAAMKDQPMGKVNPILARNDLFQVFFHFPRLFLRGQPEAVRKPLHMRIDHDATGDVERIAQDHIGGLAPD